MTAPKLSDLRGPDADGWSDVAVFVDERGRESPRFIFHGISAVPGWGQAADVRFEHGGGMSEPYLSRPVRRLGRGRLVPARIEMEGEADLADLAEQVRILREACQLFVTHHELLAACIPEEYRIADKDSPIVVVRAALAATAPKETAT